MPGGFDMRLLLAALLLAGPAPAAAETATKPKAADEGAGSVSEQKKPFDMAQALVLFDKLFPAQPDPPPERLALARFTADSMLPNGTYAALFDDAMAGVVDRVLAIDPAAFGGNDAQTKGATPTSLRQQMAKEDPYFEERMKIMQRVIHEELVKVSAVMEPKLRDGLARSIAHRFDEKQLKEINAFLVTDSGKAFAGQTMRMWVDPDVMRSMVQTLPHVFTAMPGAMARLEAETAHLPKPKKKEEPKKEDAAE